MIGTALFSAIINLVLWVFLLRLVLPTEHYFRHPILQSLFRMTEMVLRPIRRVTGRLHRRYDLSIWVGVVVLLILRGTFLALSVRAPMVAGITQSLLQFLTFVMQAMGIAIILFLMTPPYSSNPMRAIGMQIASPLLALTRPFRSPAATAAISFAFLTLIHAFITWFTVNLLSVPQFQLYQFYMLSVAGLISIYRFFTIVVVAGALLTWFSPDPRNPLVQFIWSISEPIIRPVSRMLPRLGGIDFSPILVILALEYGGGFLRQAVLQLAQGI